MRCLLHQQAFSKSQFWGWSGFVAMRWQRDGSSIAICKSSFRKGRRGGVHIPQMKLLSIHNPIFHSSSAVNASLSSRRGLIASCLISSSTRLLFIQLQRSDWPLIITYPFSPLSLSGLESYSFFVFFFFSSEIITEPAEHWPVIINLLATSHQIIFHRILWPSLASSITFPNRAHESSKISPNQRQDSCMFVSTLDYPSLLG